MGIEAVKVKGWGLEPLHKKMLEMLVYIHDFCKKNNIEYSLAYGTALGAVRHGGFIPWDDDVDIYMSAGSYEKFRTTFKCQGDHQRFFLQEMEGIEGKQLLTKLRMNGTTFIEPLYKDSGIHQGIYIDIFILHDAPINNLKKRVMCISNQYLVLKGLSNRKYVKKKAYIPLLAFMRIFPKDFLRKKALREVYKYDGCDDGIVFDVDLRSYSKSFYEKSIVFPAQTMQFCGVELCVPAKPDEYLSWVYGDYMKIPSDEVINNAQHASVWDIDRDYSEYL